MNDEQIRAGTEAIALRFMEQLTDEQAADAVRAGDESANPSRRIRTINMVMRLRKITGCGLSEAKWIIDHDVRFTSKAKVPEAAGDASDDMHFEPDSDRPGTWSATYTGLKFWHLDPRPDEVCLEDVAHGLSQLCRFSGQTTHFYSVAEHSVRCAELAQARGWSHEIMMMALMHDAAEAYCSDVPRPLKLFLPGYKEIEERVQAAIMAKLGGAIPSDTEAQLVKWLDNTLLATEKRDLMPNSPPWTSWVGMPEPLVSVIEPWQSYGAELEFSNLYRELRRKIDAKEHTDG